jgi:hypothetical protein
VLCRLASQAVSQVISPQDTRLLSLPHHRQVSQVASHLCNRHRVRQVSQVSSPRTIHQVSLPCSQQVNLHFSHGVSPLCSLQDSLQVNLPLILRPDLS